MFSKGTGSISITVVARSPRTTILISQAHILFHSTGQSESIRLSPEPIICVIVWICVV